MMYVMPTCLCRFSYLLSITSVFCHHLSQCLQDFDAQPLFVFLQQLLGMFDQPAGTQQAVSFRVHSLIGYISEMSPYLQINPPLSHFLRESVFSGKSSSGRCSTSTKTDNSAWTSGRRRSSRADTMSCGSGIRASLLRQWFKALKHKR